MNKYRNKKTVVDGITFDSKKEASQYFTLKILLKAGEITDLEIQPSFQIIPPVVWVWGGKKLSAKKYIADFAYKENGNTIIEDVKGIRTPVYVLKRQLFLLKYPEYVFREV